MKAAMHEFLALQRQSLNLESEMDKVADEMHELNDMCR